jgi:hypothetical protein
MTPRPISLLKISMGTRKNFSENYRKFVHALSRSFASPVLEQYFSNVCLHRTLRISTLPRVELILTKIFTAVVYL